MSAPVLSPAERAEMLSRWESRGTPCVDALEILEFGWLACREWAEEWHVERMAPVVEALAETQERERALREALDNLNEAIARVDYEGAIGDVEDVDNARHEAAAALASPTPRPRQDLRAKLEEMRLHDNTGDPLDVGYMRAVEELEAWLASLTPRETPR